MYVQYDAPNNISIGTYMCMKFTEKGVVCNIQTNKTTLSGEEIGVY